MRARAPVVSTWSPKPQPTTSTSFAPLNSIFFPVDPSGGALKPATPRIQNACKLLITTTVASFLLPDYTADHNLAHMQLPATFQISKIIAHNNGTHHTKNQSATFSSALRRAPQRHRAKSTTRLPSVATSWGKILAHRSTAYWSIILTTIDPINRCFCLPPFTSVLPSPLLSSPRLVSPRPLPSHVHLSTNRASPTSRPRRPDLRNVTFLRGRLTGTVLWLTPHSVHVSLPPRLTQTRASVILYTARRGQPD